MSRVSEKILLVDDEPRLLSGLRRNLGRQFDIVTASSGKDALAILAEENDIAVVLTDMQMPEMNGVELLSQIRESSPTVRRLMLTGNADQETAVAALNEGAVLRFLRKPCETETLADAINYALEDYRFSLTSQTTAPSGNRVERDSFLSMMNHEIRTPLNHIIGFSQLIQMPDTQEFEASRKFLENLRESADDLLLKLVRMMDYTRLTSSEEPAPTKAAFDLYGVMKDEIDRFKAEADKRDITLSLDGIRSKLEVVGVRDDIAIAIREILSNAVKFNNPEGHVGVTVRHDRQHLAIKITDTGAGISEEAIGEICGTFRQVHEGNDREYGGIGLGLSLASAIAERDGGSLSIDSQEGHGTTVILTLPIVSAKDCDVPA